MSANPHLEATERRERQKGVHVLFVGPSLVATKNVFKREDEAVRCEHANLPADAIDMIIEQAKSRPFDCVMIDMRRENEGNPLNVVALAALRAVGKLVVLTRPEDAGMYETMVGVDEVLPAPVAPIAIIQTIVSSTEKPPEAAPAPETVAIDTGKQDAGAVTKGFETSLSKVVKADQNLWQRFVPVANFLYKKLAIVILTALFLTFLAYGAMIVFFMTSASWSLPFELSRGHTLVEKVERDLASMRVRRNQIQQDLTSANVEVSKAQRDRRDGELQLTLSKRTTEHETELQENFKVGIEKQIARLRTVISDFKKLNGKGGFAKSINGAYSRRLITRKALNSGTLALLETLHRIAMVQNEVALKELELKKVEGHIAFLKSLRGQIDQDEISITNSPGSELAHLAREVIEARNLISTSQKYLSSAQKRAARLENSLDVTTTNIDRLAQTPAARAIDAPVMVLFVPYTNAENVLPDTPLYSCAIGIFWCSEVGRTGALIGGETNAIHPLFGKPLRGTFVEANFENSKAVTEELIHAGRPPLLF